MNAVLSAISLTAGHAPAVLGLLRSKTDGSIFADRRCVLPVDLPPIDAVLAGGLIFGVLHEIAAAREACTAAVTGFALAITRAARNVVWITESLSLAENGTPYGPGLDEAGLAPERLVMVTVARGRDALWAMEEALRCRAAGVVIGEVRGPVDQLLTRRLSLAAAAGNTLGLLLRTAPDATLSSAATRWIIASAPSTRRSYSANAVDRPGVGPPRLDLRLVRNRRGHLGAWIVEWNSEQQRFEIATHFEPVAQSAFDRPHRAAVA